MKVSNKNIDLNLVKRAKKGDYQAFDLLVIKYQTRLIATAFKFVKDIDELSLSSGKSININLIKKVLNRWINTDLIIAQS